MISFSHFHLTRNFDYESENLHEAEKGQEVSNHFLIEESGTLKIGLVTYGIHFKTFHSPASHSQLPGLTFPLKRQRLPTLARIDWRETPEAHIFKADLPGLRKDEVNVEIEEGNVLRISGERSDTWHRVERSSGQFLRRFRLPENARIDQVKASTEYGVLTVSVPKVIADRPDVRAIEISG
ncbi:hypothetical protein WN944_017901 [Citrus x changshan-huyou]|uniref:SHSP domain-containing protein n=1 Tax=Citrus x changshan-huyou TaxID=2935761 RepID=A0AAP0QE85_9ROSI